MAGLFGSAASTSQANTLGDLSKDVALQSPPDDSVSDLSFSPQSDHLAVASWDKKVRIYAITQNGGSEGKAFFEHDAPVLSCHWSPDGTKVVGAGADKMAKVIDLGANQNTATQVAAHDQPIRCVRYFEPPGSNAPMIVTGSWDKTVKYWDLRQSQPAATVQCQERVYTLDVKKNLLVIGTADRYINVINLSEPAKFYKTIQSPLKWQTRVVSCFPDASGFAVGSIEGRCAIQYVEEKDAASNFSFKCHRDPPQNNMTNVYSVNAISFHPQHGTFSTAGSDGTFHFWDGVAKHRLKGYPTTGGTISATAFDRSGQIFAYAVSYDWSKGYATNTPQYPNKVMMHPVGAEECKPRPSVKKR
ncbi:putative poly(A)+ RNA export protein [Hyaloscypha bicolor E]|uniref:Putative poly(A)+ RNA export protein n=1 Tax=Hyaloscypha bicolor E TaxID=1095630 RepID=A0A2J6T1T2_9HELO|nr:putative poly(A)+ RNA export protein [Hyaloscypha bicolor E]KAH8795712.1 WD40-repeat-containing domain protein [Hyaloscypha sp. PMI_1271]PMD56977.1 putative poly(A)+ RNA export protein [Hyaloscypha bicolor E]